MSDENKKIDEMTDEEVVDGIARETGRILNELLEGAAEHEPVKMTEAELWESLIPPFQD